MVLERAQRAAAVSDSNRPPSSTSQTPDIDWSVCCCGGGGGRGDFDVELGRTLIWDYVRTPSPSWEVDPRWLLDLTFLDTTTTTEEEEQGEKEEAKEEKKEEEEDHTCTSKVLLHLHRYRARWSIPTHLAPIPRETASVYFFVVVRQGSKVRSPHQDQDHHQDQDQGHQQTVLEASYVVESTRSVHVVGRTRFREQWLRDVLESKVLLRRAFHACRVKAGIQPPLDP
ncbi:hypothetical protein CRUP_024748 [Coryphaenoides rupestris]|nr:hypothetical protein CRUP_024748 [Coryphaenoides rupestris]